MNHKLLFVLELTFGGILFLLLRIVFIFHSNNKWLYIGLGALLPLFGITTTIFKRKITAKIFS